MCALLAYRSFNLLSTGFRNYILKGLYYPLYYLPSPPISLFRQGGDIDIYLNMSREVETAYVLSIGSDIDVFVAYLAFFLEIQENENIKKI